MLKDVRWWLANLAMRGTFALMPESRAKEQYYDAVKAVSIRIYGIVYSRSKDWEEN